jgi:hypothetical protein
MCDGWQYEANDGPARPLWGCLWSHFSLSLQYRTFKGRKRMNKLPRGSTRFLWCRARASLIKMCGAILCLDTLICDSLADWYTFVSFLTIDSSVATLASKTQSRKHSDCYIMEVYSIIATSWKFKFTLLKQKSRAFPMLIVWTLTTIRMSF